MREGAVLLRKPDAVRAAWATLPRRWGPFTVGTPTWRDLRQIAELERAVFPEPLTGLPLLARYLNPSAAYVVVRDGPVVAAYFGFERWGGVAHVIANATRPTYRRRGLARFLLTAAAPVARAYGTAGFLGEVRRSNTAQQALLASLGWRELGVVPRFFGNGEDAFLVWYPFAGHGR
jgi:ribosomal protein S18 acetylase RimI-like enzyme